MAEKRDSTPSPAPPNGDGLIDFNGNEFQGLTEAKRLEWQGVWSELRIPEEVERAAEWLRGHPGEREAIRQRGEGFYGFIVRWLLKSDRERPKSHSPYQGKH